LAISTALIQENFRDILAVFISGILLIISFYCFMNISSPTPPLAPHNALGSKTKAIDWLVIN